MMRPEIDREVRNAASVIPVSSGLEGHIVPFGWFRSATLSRARASTRRGVGLRLIAIQEFSAPAAGAPASVRRSKHDHDFRRCGGWGAKLGQVLVAPVGEIEDRPVSAPLAGRSLDDVQTVAVEENV